MKHVLIDTNILVDRSFRRAPQNVSSMEVLRRCQHGALHGYTTTWSLMTLMYLMEEARDAHGKRIFSKADITAETIDLLTFITLVDAGNATVLGGLALGWPDWEDAIIYHAANSHPLVEAIVTNDGKFVKRAKALKGIKAMTPSELLK
jgi:predicted nucleic acid-binding protein